MPLEFSRVTIPVPLVPLDELKAFLKVTDTDHDAEIASVFDAAQEEIVAYLGAGADATWTDTTAPKGVRHSIKLLTGYLYRARGDDEQAADPWPALRELLARYRDPIIA